jgi:hypothetical protein
MYLGLACKRNPLARSSHAAELCSAAHASVQHHPRQLNDLKKAAIRKSLIQCLRRGPFRIRRTSKRTVFQKEEKRPHRRVGQGQR